MKNVDLRALLTFMAFSDSNLSTFTSRVISSITGNPNFTNLSAALAQVVSAQDEFVKLLSLAQGGSRLQISNKNAAREVLLDALRQAAFEVNYIAKGDHSILISSGFDIYSEAKKAVAPANSISKLKAA